MPQQPVFTYLCLKIWKPYLKLPKVCTGNVFFFFNMAETWQHGASLHQHPAGPIYISTTVRIQSRKFISEICFMRHIFEKINNHTSSVINPCHFYTWMLFLSFQGPAMWWALSINTTVTLPGRTTASVISANYSKWHMLHSSHKAVCWLS